MARIAHQTDRARHVERKLPFAHRPPELLAARLGLHEDLGHALGALGDRGREQFDDQRPVDEHLRGAAGPGHLLRPHGQDLTGDGNVFAEPAAPLPLVVEPLFLGLVERPAGHVVDPQRRFVAARLLDEARPLPGDAWVGVLLVGVFHEQVFALRHLHFRRPLRLARHGKDRADEDAGVGHRLEGLDGDRLPPARLHREAHAVGLGGDVHVGVGDEHVHGIARREPPHRHVPRPPLAIDLLELHERG